MASATFTGNIVDENEDAIECSYQAYHVQQNKWSDVRSSESQQYSFDLSDADFLSNDNTATNNSETVVIAFWQEGADRTGLKDRFSLVTIYLDGSSVYAVDVQLIPKLAPTSNWAIPTSTTVGTNIAASPSASDVYQWDYNGFTFKHDDYHYTAMFDSVGQLTYECDWDDEEGYVTTPSVTYSAVGDYNPTLKATDAYDLSSTTSKTIRVYYNQPTVTFSQDIADPVLNDSLTISVTVDDPDSTVTNIKHYFDEELQVESTNLSERYTVTLSENKTYSYYTEVYWNDGFADQVLTVSGSVELTNQPPTAQLTYSNTNNVYTFISNAVDPEGLLDRVEYRIYVDGNTILEESPSTYEWSLIGSRIVTEADWNQVVTFYRGGQYKVECIAYDTDGLASTVESVVIDVYVDATVTVVENTAQTTYFDWE